MKKFATTIILIILLVSILMMSACSGGADTAEVDLDFDGLGSKPNAQAIDKATPVDGSKVKLSSEETTDPEVLSSIIYLIGLANQNNVECDFYAAAAYGTGEAKIKFGKDHIVGSMDTREWRVYDNGEYFFDSYGLVVEGHTIKEDGSTGKVSNAILSALSMVLNFTKRVYSPDCETFYTSKEGKTRNSTLTLYPSLDAVKYDKPKSLVENFDEYVETNYYRNDFREFSSDDLSEELDPITSGFITYDAEKGVYYLECSVNCEDTDVLDLSIKSMKKSAGTEIFAYADKRLKIEIWECGLIKNYINTNVWEATLLPTSLKLSGSSDNFYEQRFTYNKDDLEVINVPDDIKQNMMTSTQKKKK
ncbi:MAG: hypothetical protein HDT32_00665 [Clostridiales bacterium]|nr:hypothetical protein [Clostridiales bacterium]